MERIRGRNAILTGASGGLGLHIGRVLAREGVNLALVGRDLRRLETAAGDFAVYGVTLETFTADLADQAERRNLALRVRAHFNETDLLINAAGIEEYRRFVSQDPASIQRLLEINLVTPMLLALHFLPEMIERRRGHVVNIASLAGRLAMPFASAYAASKGAMCEWSFSLSTELEGTGVGVSTVCPAFVGESGVFARLGRRPPPFMGTVQPEAVGAAVVRAIKENVPEIVVSGRPARPLMALRALSPGAARWLARRLGLVDYLQAIADGLPDRETG